MCVGQLLEIIRVFGWRSPAAMRSAQSPTPRRRSSHKEHLLSAIPRLYEAIALGHWASSMLMMHIWDRKFTSGIPLKTA
ncbi:MAG: hypothetical protein MET45_27205 [Nostoc sp. LLA-1]|nr:hypothetical protein [Cyanocohniella sp. LLY]